MLTHVALLDDAQLHPADAVTLTLPEPPEPDTVALIGAML
jgi:hypothetical protein